MSTPFLGQVRVAGDFLHGSAATGILVAIVTPSNTLYLNVIKRNSDQLHVVGTVEGVMGGHHHVSLFIVNLLGLPFGATATTPQTVFVMNSKL